MFVVKERATRGMKNVYDILDDAGKPVGLAQQKTATMAMLIGMVTGAPPTQIDFTEKPDDSLVFTIRRRGYLMKKVEVVDAQGQVVGRYKAKMLSLAGGFNVYDPAGKHIAEIRGKLTKSEYTFFSPDGKTELGKVSKKWGGMMREMFTSADTYGVQIAPAAADDPKMKMLILGAAVAIDALMSTRGGAAAGGEDD
jgi:uncharacterized protein YxjI